MVTEDYAKRLIGELVRMMVKTIFGKDDMNPETLIIDEDARGKLYKYIELSNEGRINDAENLLYVERDTENEELLKAALLFYGHINEFSENQLNSMNFSREEIKDGIDTALQDFGYNGFEGLEIMDNLFK